jgi:hypothetical protein
MPLPFTCLPYQAITLDHRFLRDLAGRWCEGIGSDSFVRIESSVLRRARRHGAERRYKAILSARPEPTPQSPLFSQFDACEDSACFAQELFQQ